LKAVIAAVGLVASGLASAGVTFYTPITNFEDDNLDFHVDSCIAGTVGCVAANNGNGKLDIGERLLSPFELYTTSGNFTGQGPSAITQELTGILDIQVIDKIFTPDNPAIPGNQAAYTFVFGPSTDATGPLAGLQATYGAGVLAGVWLDGDATQNLDVINQNCGALGAIGVAGTCLGDASDGSLFLVAGFGVDNDELWFADDVASDDISVIRGIGATSGFGQVIASVSILYNGTGRGLAQIPCFPYCGGGVASDGLIDMTVTGSLLGGTGLPLDGAFSRSDFDFSIGVPEPTSLALTGLALLGLGAMRRRKA
jgi:hypothetical protein